MKFEYGYSNLMSTEAMKLIGELRKVKTGAVVHGHAYTNQGHGHAYTNQGEIYLDIEAFDQPILPFDSSNLTFNSALGRTEFMDIWLSRDTNKAFIIELARLSPLVSLTNTSAISNANKFRINALRGFIVGDPLYHYPTRHPTTYQEVNDNKTHELCTLKEDSFKTEIYEKGGKHIDTDLESIFNRLLNDECDDFFIFSNLRRNYTESAIIRQCP